MKKLRVMTVVGTRPEIIRLSQLIKLIDNEAEQLLVHTDQNSTESLSEIFFADLRLRDPDVHLNADNSSFSLFCATVFPAVERELIRFSPDVFLVLGDTNSSLTALVAKKHGVPVYHLEAGNRSFDSNVPEELNRRLVDTIADVNFPYSEFARQNLLKEGHSQRFIFKSGSPMGEVYNQYRNQIERSQILNSLALEPKSYLLVSLHRQENIDDPYRLRTALNAVESARAATGKTALVSAHPRLLDKAKDLLADFSEWIVSGPFGFLDYSFLQMNAFCVVSDSGSISEEAAVAGFSAVTLRDSMERQEALEMGVVPMVGLEAGTLASAVQFAVGNQVSNLPSDYAIDNFSVRVWSVISSTASLAHTWSGRREP